MGHYANEESDEGSDGVLQAKKKEQRKVALKKRKARKMNKAGICLVNCYYDSVKRAAKVR